MPKTAHKANIGAGGKSYGWPFRQALKGHRDSQWFELEGHRYQFVARAPQDGPQSAGLLVLTVSNLSWSRQAIAERYRIRWTTECFFRHLKSNGFDLEEPGFPSAGKLRLRVAIVVVLYVICVAEGLRQFDRTRAKSLAPDAPLRLREAVFGRGYPVVANELVVVHVSFIGYWRNSPSHRRCQYAWSSSMSSTKINDEG